ncbi:MAG: hypothetical protein PHC69_11060 [Ruminiclostridium sp.]|nr:hypothetical protein [Ruminiclostridium sp.]
MGKEKKSKNNNFDDNRVIADMNIDGMPGSMFRRKTFNESEIKKDKKEAVEISKDERRAIVRDIATSYILFGVIFFGLLALFLLFYTKVWLK